MNENLFLQVYISCVTASTSIYLLRYRITRFAISQGKENIIAPTRYSLRFFAHITRSLYDSISKLFHDVLSFSIQQILLGCTDADATSELVELLSILNQKNTMCLQDPNATTTVQTVALYAETTEPPNGML